MRVEKQKTRLPVKKFEFKGGSLRRKHSKLFPNVVRGLIVGPSNCGKTNLILSLLVALTGLKFENVYLCTRSSDKAKYGQLEQILRKVKGIGFYWYDGVLVNVEEVKRNSVVIFDDVITENQNLIREMFAKGRHRGLDVFYLAQSYSKIPKQLIRDNANMIFLFRMDDMNLKHAYSDHVAADMSLKEFRDLCLFCWREPHGFVVIDRESPKNKGGYRKGIDGYIRFE